MAEQEKKGLERLGIRVMASVVCVTGLFLLFTAIFKNVKTVELKNLELMNRQLLNHIDDLMKQFDYASQHMQTDETIFWLMRANEREASERNEAQMQNYLNMQRISAENAYAIALLLDNGMEFTNVGSVIDPAIIRNSSWYQEFCEENITRCYSPMVDETGNTQAEEKNSVLIAYAYENGGYTGSLVFSCDFSVFEETIKEYTAEDMDVIIYGRDNQILYQNNPKNNIKYEKIQPVIASTQAIYQTTVESLMGADVIGYTRIGAWKVITNLSGWLVLKHALPTFLFASVLFGLFYAVVLALTVHQRKERQMEFALLSVQINPHFIYKTLNTIAYLARKGRNEDVIQATKALEEILRDKLRIDEIRIYDTIEREISIIRQYITIQQIYYDCQIRLEEEIEDGLMERQIPKNIIHPLVENALYHGILMKEDEEVTGGTIRVSIKSEGKELVISVWDDGCGMTQEKLHEVFYSKKRKENGERGKHIGIMNIRNRLSQLSGLKFTIEAFSEPGKGTEVKLRLRMGGRKDR